MLVRHDLAPCRRVLLGACGGATPWSAPALGAATPGAFERSFKEPALIAFDDQSGRLESWPLRGRPNERRRFISGRLGITVAGGMAGNGDVLSIAGYSPAALVASTSILKPLRLSRILSANHSTSRLIRTERATCSTPRALRFIRPARNSHIS